MARAVFFPLAALSINNRFTILLERSPSGTFRICNHLTMRGSAQQVLTFIGSKRTNDEQDPLLLPVTQRAKLQYGLRSAAIRRRDDCVFCEHRSGGGWSRIYRARWYL